MINEDSHLGTIDTLLVEDPILEDEGYLRVLGIAEIIVPDVDFWLRSGRI